MQENKLNKVIGIVRSHLSEEVPTVALSHGEIAGTVEAGDDPPVRKRKKERKYMKGPGRKFWLEFLKSFNGNVRAS